MEDCIFCKIINKEIPASIVYEDERMIAFDDINPQAPVHVLLIPKEHYPSLNEIPEDKKDVLSHLILPLLLRIQDSRPICRPSL
jgi:Diadenosine tetraphosphate (Ap4A) hydrolase and other HIT family hydrolases